MHNLTIKATYKQKTYVLKGEFPTEESIKAEIINRNIGDFSGPQTFSLRYSTEAKNFEQVLRQYDVNFNRTLKVQILKNKKNNRRKQANSLNQHNSSQQISDKKLKQKELIEILQAARDKSAQAQIQKQSKESEHGVKSVQMQKETEQSELPDFDLSVIHAKNPQNPFKQIIKRNEKQLEQFCWRRWQKSMEQIFTELTKRWRSEIQLKMEEKVQDLMFIAKRQNAEMRDQFQMYMQRAKKDQRRYLDIKTYLVFIENTLANEINCSRDIMKQLSSRVQKYQQKFDMFYKDNNLINEVKFQIQTRQIEMENKIKQLASRVEQVSGSVLGHSIIAQPTASLQPKQEKFPHQNINSTQKLRPKFNPQNNKNQNQKHYEQYIYRYQKQGQKFNAPKNDQKNRENLNNSRQKILSNLLKQQIHQNIQNQLYQFKYCQLQNFKYLYGQFHEQIQKRTMNQKLIQEISVEVKHSLNMYKKYEAQNKQFKKSFNQVQSKLEIYKQKIQLLQQGFKTINEVNFEIQNSYLALKTNNPELAVKIKQPTQPLPIHPALKQFGYIFQAKPNQKSFEGQINQPQIFRPEFKPIDKVQQKDSFQPQITEDRKQFKEQMSKQSQKSIQRNQKQNQNHFDCLIEQIQKPMNLYVGQSYQPQLRIKNTGTTNWPPNVLIFNKDSKISSEICSLNPGEETIYKDSKVYKAKKQGQNIQIMYQVIYLENNKKKYIGSPLSIFIKVKQSPNYSLMTQKEDKSKKGQFSFEHKSQAFDWSIDSSINSLLNSSLDENIRSNSQEFIRRINQVKRKLDLRSKTTNEIKESLQELGINENNFKQSDEKWLEGIIFDFCLAG